jgi:hypothetical protein
MHSRRPAEPLTRERLRQTPKSVMLLEQQHPAAALGKRRRSRQPTDARTDDDRVPCALRAHAVPFDPQELRIAIALPYLIRLVELHHQVSCAQTWPLHSRVKMTRNSGRT